MLSVCEITDIFYLCDEFSIEFNRELLNDILAMFLKTCRLRKCTQISFVDSTTLDVYYIK